MLLAAPDAPLTSPSEPFTIPAAPDLYPGIIATSCTGHATIEDQVHAIRKYHMGPVKR